MTGPGSSFIPARMSVGIDIARICTMFLIVSGHYMQLPGFYSHFSGGVGYPFQPGDISQFRDSLANQAWGLDRLFLVVDFSYWSLNFTFFALSGLSLWFSTRKSGVFSLRDYFFKRFTGVYLGYFIAALAAFLIAVTLLGHKPGEHDLNYLLLGVTRARETVFYNDTLWFMSILFILYLIYPFIVFLYARLGPVAVFAISTASSYFFIHKHVLATVTFLPTAFTFFIIGIAVAELLCLASDILARYKKTGALIALSTSVTCVYLLHSVLYASIMASNRYEYDTHASGLLFFFLFLSGGMLLPLGQSKTLRTLGAATYPVYLFHYLLVRVCSVDPSLHETISRARFLAFWPLGESILAASTAIFVLLLTLGVVYNRFVVATLTAGMHAALGREIRVRRRD
ncbi:acyltransferase family protein [Solidesulfovibrio sp.]